MASQKHAFGILHSALNIAAALVAAKAAATTYTGEDLADWTAATADGLSIPAGETVTLTNGEFQLTSASRSFDAGSALEILADATLATTVAGDFLLGADNARMTIDGGGLVLSNMSSKVTPFRNRRLGDTSGAVVDVRNGGTFSVLSTHSYFYVSGTGNRLLVRDGATLALPNGSGTHKARSFKVLNATGCTIAVSNATVNAHSLSFGDSAATDISDYNNLNFYGGNADRNTLLLHNATVNMYNNGAYGLHFGYCGNPERGYSTFSGWVNHSFSNRVEITGDGTVTTTLKAIHLNGYSDKVRFSSGKLDIHGWNGFGISLAGTSNRFEHAGGTLTADRIRVLGEGAVFEVCGGTNTVGVTLGGATNAWSRNSSLLVSSGLQSGSVAFAGSNHFARVTGGAFTGKIPLSQAANSFFVDGGAVTSQVTITGFGNTLVIGPGAKLMNTVTSGSLINALSFSSATNCTLVVSNGTFISRTSLAGASGSKPAWWINCPGSAIEFRGRNPAFVFPQNGSYWKQMYIGRSDETYPESSPLPNPVKLRFIPPGENFAAAPLRNETPSANAGDRNIAVYGNAVIEVSDKEIPRAARMRKLLVPLMYCRNAFGGMLANETRMEQINANAILPERARLVYDSDDKTLYCELPSIGATIFSLR